MDYDIEMFIDQDVLAILKEQSRIKYPNKEMGIVLNDTSCCGGVIHIDFMPLEDIKNFTDIILVFPKTYKNFGIPIYIDKGILQDPIPHMRIIISSTNPLKFAFENNDFWEKDHLPSK
jgi:hypothetical protein